MKRKWIAILTTVSVLVSVCGCGAVQAQVENVETAETQTTSEVLETTVEQTIEEETVAEQAAVEVDRSETFAMLADMGAGWNLGNTLDAHGGSSLELMSEVSWGNPKTTPEMIQAVAEEGFKTIRIPVTWSTHVSTGPEYRINPAWLDRVEEVVKYAMDCDMYVILDTHHEPDYWLKPQTSGLEDVEKELSAIWQQIAERFADYDEHLLFEGMNEPRIKGSPQEWTGGDSDGRKAVNALNQVFVDTVRATGGNNADRTLIICPYGNSVSDKSLIELEIPQDEHIAVAVHLYTPYFFTFKPDSGNVNVWDGSLKKDIESVMSQVNEQLIQKGVPVIITEFGAVHKEYQDENGNTVSNKEDVLKWLADYMEVTTQYGIPCIWWDNNVYNSQGENFGLFDRKNLTWFDKDIADAFVTYAK